MSAPHPQAELARNADTGGAASARGDEAVPAPDRRRRTRPRWLANWLERHQHPASRWLHYIGIPLAIGAVPLAGAQLYAWRWDLWWRPAALLVAGYVLQYVGHRIEGNDLGEVILIKKLLGRPYRAVSPRYAGPASPEARDAPPSSVD